MRRRMKETHSSFCAGNYHEINYHPSGEMRDAAAATKPRVQNSRLKILRSSYQNISWIFFLNQISGIAGRMCFLRGPPLESKSIKRERERER